MTNNYRKLDESDEGELTSVRISVKTTQVHTYRTYIDHRIGGLEGYRDLIDVLHSAGPDDVVEIMLLSPGGSADTMTAIINAIRASEATTVAIIMGTCMSAATAIALACDNVVLTDHCEFMVHNASYGEAGSAGQLKYRVEFKSKQILRLLLDVYEGFMTEEEIKAMFEQDSEWWMDQFEIERRLIQRNEYFKKKMEENQSLDNDEQE